MPPGSAAQRTALDPLGAITVTTGLGLFIFAVVRTENVGWGAPVTLACLAGAAALLTLFVIIEARHRAPLLPLAVFRLRNVNGGVLCGILLSSAMLSLFFFLTMYMQRVLVYSAFETGLAYVPMGLTVLLVAVGLASRLVSRFGPSRCWSWDSPWSLGRWCGSRRSMSAAATFPTCSGWP
ncbi:hypothetical protein F4561_000427 [Lipingzhangella halophila]|uniref:MFS transporter n=1 Tax=Lipingzhangella halophila TaxID=1783352 RepID=A0A7W7W076_9ACTN|nr:hypothetical protein [Lipingzhangella halophila]MBB4929607.1 hypothetical protein [Lipingzhangella halophila]